MPTITIWKADLERLVGLRFDPHGLDQALALVKGEIKEYDERTEELRIELADTNRPDLWSCEGLARQIRCWLTRRPPRYPFLTRRLRPAGRLLIEPGVQAVRPYAGAFIARDLALSESLLSQLILTQEKLAEIYGRRRRAVSIGYYRLDALSLPIRYTAVAPTDAAFIPLGFEEKMTLAEILEVHPKGRAYRQLIEPADRYPLLVDSAGRILSFPPIINSREIGEVRPGDSQLLVEATGQDLNAVLLIMTILAVNLADRGATIMPMEARYAVATPYGQRLQIPASRVKPLAISLDEVAAVLGEPLGRREVAAALTRYGYQVSGWRRRLTVLPPPYREDLIHPVDVIEDIAVSQGYSTFRPSMPRDFTVGGLMPPTAFSNRARELMVGYGFEEISANILTSREELLTRMQMPHGEAAEIENVMSEQYALLRSWLIPSLLRVEATSSRAFYPHRLFEVGEVVIPDGAQTALHLGVLLAHAGAHFSDLHTTLDRICYDLGLTYRLVPIAHPSCIPGRAGQIMIHDQDVGMIGELHPGVLEAWQIGMPCVVFELACDPLIRS